MMLKFFSVLLFSLTATLTFGQTLSKQHLLKDLHFLNEALVNGHPANYNPRISVTIEQILDEAKTLPSDSLSAFNYTLWIEKAIFKIGCVHTSITRNPLLQYTRSVKNTPLTAAIQHNSLIITNCVDTAQIGKTILAINEYSASDIITKFSQYKASDGCTTSFSKEYFHVASSRLFAILLDGPDYYTIKTDQGTFKLPAVELPLMRKEGLSRNYLIKNDKNIFYYQNRVPIIRINSFAKSDKKFIQKVFKTIASKNEEKLIVDLRHNLGGNRKAAVMLTKYLANSAFSYQILQPKLTISKYINSKGKINLLLSKLKYNLGNIVNARKTELGKAFVYSYKPRKRNNYNGKLTILTDGFTASSSTMVTSWLKQYSNAVFIGSQAAGGYNGNNGGSFLELTLPESRINIKFPAYRLILDAASDKRDGIDADIELEQVGIFSDNTLQRAIYLLNN